MTEFKIIEQEGKLVIDSRIVAEMVGKQHWEILRMLEGTKDGKTKGFISILNDNNFVVVDFFIKNEYTDGKGEVRPCYLLTKKGCDMVANKMTGEKGILFTATYVTKFEEMENALKTKTPTLPTTYKEALQTLLIEVEKNEQLVLENKQKEQIIGEMKPKADYTDKILNSKGLVTITQIAKDYGMSGQAMNNKLHDLEIQYNQSGQWLLYSKYHDKGFTHSKTIPIIRTDGSPDTRINTKWTQKGRLFLYDILKQNDILPMIEKEDIAS